MAVLRTYVDIELGHSKSNSRMHWGAWDEAVGEEVHGTRSVVKESRDALGADRRSRCAHSEEAPSRQSVQRGALGRGTQQKFRLTLLPRNVIYNWTNSK